MRRSACTLLGLAALVALVACEPNEVQRRFACERELWRADRELAATLALPAARRAVPLRKLAQRYASVSQRSLELSQVLTDEDDGSMRALSIRAHFRQAQVAAALLDSFLLGDIYERMATHFGEDEAVRARVDWSRGQLAEGRGETNQAQDHYAQACSLEDSDLALRACLRLADLAAHREDWLACRQILDRQRDRLPPGEAIAAHWEVDLRYLEAELADGLDLEAALKLARNLALDHDEHPHAVLGLILVGEAALVEEPDLALELALDLKGVSPEPELRARTLMLEARALEALDRWGEALVAIRDLKVEHPTTLAAIQSHAMAATHYRRTGDRVAEQDALDRAARELHANLSGYPDGRLNDTARELLVQLLRRLGRFDEAVELQLSAAGRAAGTSRELELLFAAAQISELDLLDHGRAAKLFELVADRFPRTDLGVRAHREAERLRSYGS